MKIKHSEPFGPLRRKDYPEMGDQLDAVFKGFEAIKDVVVLPDETLEWLDQVRAVKAKFKKPQE